jgi:6-hydroxycyclohex-1-ene-1-carbonyl-CoA dehydrogenase
VDGAMNDKELLSLSVVADAVSTAYQAVKRAGLEAGDVAVVVGAGGVGGFVTQIASALGATVIAVDVSAERLEQLSRFGAKHRVAIAGRGVKELRKEIGELVKGTGVASLRHRIFECSGTKDGQLLAFALLGRASTLVQVGYTPDTVELRLSNLMAYDATVHGTWGCPPEAYVEVLALIAEGKVAVAPFVEIAPMAKLNELLEDMAHHRLKKRMVLVP